MGLFARRHVESSWTRDGTHVPCIGRWVCNHWTVSEVLNLFLLFWLDENNWLTFLKNSQFLFFLFFFFLGAGFLVKSFYFFFYPLYSCKQKQEDLTKGVRGASTPFGLEYFMGTSRCFILEYICSDIWFIFRRWWSNWPEGRNWGFGGRWGRDKRRNRIGKVWLQLPKGSGMGNPAGSATLRSSIWVSHTGIAQVVTDWYFHNEGRQKTKTKRELWWVLHDSLGQVFYRTFSFIKLSGAGRTR